MKDPIERQTAIDALGERPMVWMDSDYEIAQRNQYDRDKLAIETVPSAQPELHYDEWCTDCKEYDQERHCCPRFNRVIRGTVEEYKAEHPEPCDDPRADVYYLAEEIGIHRLYALVVELRGEPEPCEDAVSREAAIDIFDDYNVSVENGDLEAYSRDRKRLCELPSAQPEIIYCKDCKHWDGVDTCDVIDAPVWDNDFCSFAERRSDE